MKRIALIAIVTALLGGATAFAADPCACEKPRLQHNTVQASQVGSDVDGNVWKYSRDSDIYE